MPNSKLLPSKKTMISKAIKTIFVLSVLLLVFGQSQANLAKFDFLAGITAGKQEIVDGNIQKAKQEAISKALNIALQNAFAHLTSRQIFSSNLIFFYEQILSNTKDYIIVYRVLSAIENKGEYLVSVESKIDLTLLEKILTNTKVINANKEKPNLLFFIVEKTPFDLLPNYWWGNNPIPYQSHSENIIIDEITKKDFFVIQNSSDRIDPSFYNIRFDSIYDIKSAIYLGKLMKADIIVFGKAVSSNAINRMGKEKTFNAKIDLTAFNVETKEEAIKSEVQATSKSGDDREGNKKALIKAAKLCAQDLSEKLNDYWTLFLKKEHTFDIRIQGDKFLPRFVALEKRLKQMPKIQNIQPKEMSSDFAILEISYQGKPSFFADKIMLTTFDSFGIEIFQDTESHITIKFIEKDIKPLLNDEGSPEITIPSLESSKSIDEQTIDEPTIPNIDSPSFQTIDEKISVPKPKPLSNKEKVPQEPDENILESLPLTLKKLNR